MINHMQMPIRLIVSHCRNSPRISCAFYHKYYIYLNVKRSVAERLRPRPHPFHTVFCDWYSYSSVPPVMPYSRPASRAGLCPSKLRGCAEILGLAACAVSTSECREWKGYVTKHNKVRSPTIRVVIVICIRSSVRSDCECASQTSLASCPLLTSKS